jgi:hypothetical protein
MLYLCFAAKTGEFDKDLPHGRGKYRFTNGSVYVGEALRY